MSGKEFCIDGACIPESELKDMKATKKMSMKEFLSHCYASGGNWTAMLMSGIRNLSEKNNDFKMIYDSMPGDKEYSFADVLELIDPLVETREK